MTKYQKSLPYLEREEIDGRNIFEAKTLFVVIPVDVYGKIDKRYRKDVSKHYPSLIKISSLFYEYNKKINRIYKSPTAKLKHFKYRPLFLKVLPTKKHKIDFRYIILLPTTYKEKNDIVKDNIRYIKDNYADLVITSLTIPDIGDEVLKELKESLIPTIHIIKG